MITQSPQTAGRPGARLAGKRVLIVEDEAMVALDLQFAFEDEGAEVIGPAQKLAAALRLAAEAPAIDAALLDVDIAGESVYPVAEALRARGVPFAFQTGHGTHGEIGTLFPGAATFTKPALPEALIAHLAEIALN